jgi:tRNA dimethylallyltransferase
MTKNFFITILGPTAVGKSDFVRALSQRLPDTIEVINGDMGQLYSPLSIGTAKPKFEYESVKHHLFDVLDTPIHYSCSAYRDAAIACMKDIWSKNKIPVVVGGSSFYIESLFFEQHKPEARGLVDSQGYRDKTSKELWNELAQIDQERAQAINPNDRYRIERALTLWHTTGRRPSEYKPLFNAPGRSIVLFLTRERDELYGRIQKRVVAMMQQGWADEVASLDTAWHLFLKEKKLIGYREIIDFIAHGSDEKRQELLVQRITQQTQAYAKRQVTFWRSLSNRLGEASIKNISEINLTFLDLDLYIDQLAEQCTLF